MFVKAILPEEIEKLPRASFPGSVEVIDEVDALYRSAIEYLSSRKVLGFDTESRPTFSPNQHPYGISLLQLSSGERAFLFRIKDIGMTPELCSLLSDPDILKIGAAVTDDIRGLQKYSDFEAGGFVDLQKIVWEWGIKDKSVKKMAAITLGVKISKTQQLSNWEAQVLSDSQIMYAATDAWVCERMYSVLLESPKNPLSEEEMAPHHPEGPSAKEGKKPFYESFLPGMGSSKKKKPSRKRKNPSFSSSTSSSSSSSSSATSSSVGKTKRRPKGGVKAGAKAVNASSAASQVAPPKSATPKKSGKKRVKSSSKTGASSSKPSSE